MSTSQDTTPSASVPRLVRRSRAFVAAAILAVLGFFYWLAWMIEELASRSMERIEEIGERVFAWSKVAPKGSHFPPNTEVARESGE